MAASDCDFLIVAVVAAADIAVGVPNRWYSLQYSLSFGRPNTVLCCCCCCCCCCCHEQKEKVLDTTLQRLAPDLVILVVVVTMNPNVSDVAKKLLQFSEACEDI